MIIGIDISSLPYGTGVSEYTKQLVLNLLALDQKNKYKLFFGSLRQKVPINFLETVKKYPNCQIISYPLPPSLLHILWNKLHIFPIELLVGLCDIFHTSDWTQPPTKKSKTISTVHDLTPLLYPSWHHKKTISAHSLKLKLALRENSGLIFVSNNTKNDFSKLFPHTHSQNTTIYEASNSNYKPIKKPKGDYILATGTREPRKNLKNVLLAFSKIYNNYPKLKLKIVGKYGWGDDIKPQKNVEILGYVTNKQLIALHQNAFCLVYPSLYEGFGLPVLNSMSCGVPVITSNTSSLPEITQNSGILVDPTKPIEIQKAIIRLLSNPSLHKKLSKQGLLSSRKFSWQKTAQQTLRFYNQVYSNKS